MSYAHLFYGQVQGVTGELTISFLGPGNYWYGNASFLKRTYAVPIQLRIAAVVTEKPNL